jgi:hypothetical protein
MGTSERTGASDEEQSASHGVAVWLRWLEGCHSVDPRWVFSTDGGDRSGHLEYLHVPMLECGQDGMCSVAIVETFPRVWPDVDHDVLMRSGVGQRVRESRECSTPIRNRSPRCWQGSTGWYLADHPEPDGHAGTGSPHAGEPCGLCASC